MKQRLSKSFLAIPAGLAFNSCILTISHFNPMPDFLVGSLMGFGIGIMALPITLKKMRTAYS
ncbi:MAG: hypothetical protein JWQ27_50 [Ferruginibacter sp.]|nr:hypothetical protein [Ferruginibacter sp.]